MVEIAQLGIAADSLNTAVLLLPFLGAAVVTDVLSRRVPNVLIALMLTCGFAAQLATAPTLGSGLLDGIGGAAVGLIILLPFYVLGGMAAGDVKLLAGVGTFLGPNGALIAGVWTLGAGAALGLIVIACRCVGAVSSRRFLNGVTYGNGSAMELPYSLAVAAGALTAAMQ